MVLMARKKMDLEDLVGLLAPHTGGTYGRYVLISSTLLQSAA